MEVLASSAPMSFVSPPPPRGKLSLCGNTDYFTVQTPYYPNWWFRFWQRALLGFTWEEMGD